MRNENSFPFSDEELKTAVKLVGESMVDSLPDEIDPPHVFSDTFREKMNKLIAKERARRPWRSFLRSAAAVFAVVSIMTVVWFSTDADAWASFRRWTRKVIGRDTVVYQYSGPTSAAGLPAYELTWLPDGYTFAFEMDEIPGMSKRIAYKNGEQDNLYFIYGFMSDGQETTVTITGEDEDSTIYESVTVAGMPGELYYADGGGSNVLQWFDDETGISFGLQTNLGKEVMLQIAENIKPVR